MATPTTKAELKAYAKRRLGDPVIEINISDDQADDAIDYTIEKFQHFHYEGAERVYLKHKFTAAEITAAKTDAAENAADGSTEWLTQNNFISVPDHIMSIEGMFGFTDKGTRNMFDIRSVSYTHLTLPTKA